MKEVIYLHDILGYCLQFKFGVIFMRRVIPAANREDVNEWSPSHETPTLLSFTKGRVDEKNLCCSLDELSEFLTQKFAETFQ